MSSSRPFMAEHDVVRAACSRSGHPLSDSVFSKRVGTLISIGSTVRTLQHRLVTRLGWSIEPELLQALMVSLITATVIRHTGPARA